jgi:DeoR/GlpR family transcriptional regulator of sugar metabolism
MQERLSQIVALVEEHQKMSVKDLSACLNVSEVTIRKDLNALEDGGVLTREHGYAVKKDAADIRNRMSISYDTKISIAQEALALVDDNETVMIGSGSTCALFAESLAQNKPNVTIITHSAYVAEHVSKLGNNKIILLGGLYQGSSQTNVGGLVRLCAREFYVTKMFIGTDGFIPNVGFMGSDMIRTEAIKAMAASAKDLIVLTDSSKFGHGGNILQFSQYEISRIITDEGISPQYLDLFKNCGVKVTIAKRHS